MQGACCDRVLLSGQRASVITITAASSERRRLPAKSTQASAISSGERGPLWCRTRKGLEVVTLVLIEHVGHTIREQK